MFCTVLLVVLFIGAVWCAESEENGQHEVLNVESAQFMNPMMMNRYPFLLSSMMRNQMWMNPMMPMMPGMGCGSCSVMCLPTCMPCW